jgi:hypothetical protein
MLWSPGNLIFAWYYHLRHLKWGWQLQAIYGRTRNTDRSNTAQRKPSTGTAGDYQKSWGQQITQKAATDPNLCSQEAVHVQKDPSNFETKTEIWTITHSGPRRWQSKQVSI